jgi:uncharacterized membrane protein YbhN (UPF0104 family)
MDNMFRRIPWRAITAVGVLVLTVVVFVNYFATHAAVRQQLQHTAPLQLLALLLLYSLFVGSLALINNATLRFCKLTLGFGESLLLTMYSSIINFFGPLQSGPAFRALYLKRRHGVNLRRYTVASLAYYGFYALFNILCLLSGWLGWWLVPISLLLLAVGLRQRDRGAWLYLALATLSQIALLVVIFYIELKAVAPATHFGQAVIYAGVANLALFVSLTPGAIGFREAFLVFSQQLHHISDATIVAANLIDRSIYIVLLLGLALIIFGSHANRRFSSLRQPRAERQHD